MVQERNFITVGVGNSVVSLIESEMIGGSPANGEDGLAIARSLLQPGGSDRSTRRARILTPLGILPGTLEAQQYQSTGRSIPVMKQDRDGAYMMGSIVIFDPTIQIAKGDDGQRLGLKPQVFLSKTVNSKTGETEGSWSVRLVQGQENKPYTGEWLGRLAIRRDLSDIFVLDAPQGSTRRLRLVPAITK